MIQNAKVIQNINKFDYINKFIKNFKTWKIS